MVTGKIRKVLQIAYIILMIMLISLLAYEGIFSKNTVYNPREVQNCVPISNLQTEWVDDKSFSHGGYDQVTWEIQDIDESSVDVCFYTIHQCVEAYIGEERVYGISPSEDNIFGRTPGNFWNCIPVTAADVGKTMTIRLIPIYTSNIGEIPTFFIGDKWLLFRRRLINNLITAFLATVSIVMGLIFLVWLFINRKSAGIDKSILHIGSFSVFMGVWKMADLDTSVFFLRNEIMAAAIPIVALFLVTIPALMFIRDFLGERYSRFYNRVIGIGIVVIYVVLVLQLLNILDFRETLFLSHILFYIMVASCAVDMAREVRKEGWSTSLKIAAFCLVACFIGLVVDVSIYYIYVGSISTGFGIAGFLSYVVAMGAFRVKESFILIEKGRKASHYKDMAYNDSLTGVLSRAAYMEYVTAEEFDFKDYTVAILDLNNLKLCNDTFGHEAGDRYILNSSKIIRKVFGDSGLCFRMGGDEFCVLLHGVKAKECQKLYQKLRKYEKQYNRENPEEFNIQIAFGCAEYDKEKDYDISDTIRRADKYMYKNKIEIKG